MTLDPLCLPGDVVVSPARDLAPEVRELVPHSDGDYLVTRPRTRTVTSVVDARTAALLEHFRTPSTIVDAVLAFCEAEGLDPQETLEDAFDALVTLAGAGMLVPAGSAAAERVAASLGPGGRVDGIEVVEAVQLLADTEVYRARGADGEPLALKVAGPAAGPEATAAIHHEAAVLALLPGHFTPRLVSTGEIGGRPYLATEWRDGVDLYAAGEEARLLPGPIGRDHLLRLAGAVLEAYAGLHAAGVLHGDVHPGNALVDALGAVTILDLGVAAVAGAGLRALSGGIETFQAPEIVRARAQGIAAPATAAAEQYSVAALIHFVLTGAHTHRFSLRQDEMRRQVLEDPPVSFGQLGGPELPAVEACLARALAKSPEQRFGSVGELLAEFRRAAPPERSTPPPPPAPGGRLEALRDELRAPGEAFSAGLSAPTASLAHGAEGIALATLRFARAGEDAAALAGADLWASHAVRELGGERALYDDATGITPEVYGRASFFHHASGVHAVQALVCQGRADRPAQQRAVEDFLAASATSESVDLVFGRSGLLLGCALMLEALPGDLAAGDLLDLGGRLSLDVWQELEREPPIGAGGRLGALGVAHGWAGYLYALLRWAAACGADPPDGVRERLDQLLGLGIPAGRGMRWPATAGDPVPDTGLAAGWCNGAAGFAHLFAAAHEEWGDERHDLAAARAAWSAYEGSTDASGSLCCGLAGRAYALLGRYRRTRDDAWLARAHSLAARAAAGPGIAEHRLRSLFYGELGIAVLLADLGDPDFARMPAFEPEGWGPPQKFSHSRNGRG